MKEHSALRLGAAGLISGAMLPLAFFALRALPMAEMVKEFGIPLGIATTILNIVESGGWIVTAITILAALGTGGLGLIAATRKETIRRFLLQEIKKKGRRAVIAW